MRIGFLTSCEERCGIADYSRHLTASLRRQAGVEAVDVVPATFRHAPPAVYAAMGRALSGGDVAHVQHAYASFGGMHPLRCGWGHLAAAVEPPLLLTVHELDLRATGRRGLPLPVETAYKRWFNRGVFLHPRVTSWLAHSLEIREALVALGAPEERVFYLPLPASPPEPARRPARLRWPGRRVLVIPGFLARRKGYDVALAALRELPPEFLLVAAGGAHVADHSNPIAWVRAEAAALGLADRLVVTGFLPEADLEAVVGEAELVLAPFREMSASASLRYALSRGKAVVASDLRENRELPCVRLFPAGDPSALAGAVRELAGAPERRRALERAALEYAAAHGYQALAARMVELYARLMTGAGSTRPRPNGEAGA